MGVPIIRLRVSWGLYYIWGPIWKPPCWGCPQNTGLHMWLIPFGSSRYHKTFVDENSLQPASLKHRKNTFWVLPPLCNCSWIIFVIQLHIALTMTPKMDCCRPAAVPNLDPNMSLCIPICPCISLWGSTQNTVFRLEELRVWGLCT